MSAPGGRRPRRTADAVAEVGIVLAMLFLTKSVTRAARRPLVVGDMPFGSYQVSDEAALENAIRFVKEAGADVVKL